MQNYVCPKVVPASNHLKIVAYNLQSKNIWPVSCTVQLGYAFYRRLSEGQNTCSIFLSVSQLQVFPRFLSGKTICQHKQKVNENPSNGALDSSINKTNGTNPSLPKTKTKHFWLDIFDVCLQWSFLSICQREHAKLYGSVHKMRTLKQNMTEVFNQITGNLKTAIID